MLTLFPVSRSGRVRPRVWLVLAGTEDVHGQQQMVAKALAFHDVDTRQHAVALVDDSLLPRLAAQCTDDLLCVLHPTSRAFTYPTLTVVDGAHRLHQGFQRPFQLAQAIHAAWKTVPQLGLHALAEVATATLGQELEGLLQHLKAPAWPSAAWEQRQRQYVRALEDAKDVMLRERLLPALHALADKAAGGRVQRCRLQAYNGTDDGLYDEMKDPLLNMVVPCYYTLF